MREIGRGDGYGGDIVARQQVAIVGVNMGHVVSLRDFSRPRFVQIADGKQLRLWHIVVDMGMPGAADDARADHAESCLTHFNSFSMKT